MEQSRPPLKLSRRHRKDRASHRSRYGGKWQENLSDDSVSNTKRQEHKSRGLAAIGLVTGDDGNVFAQVLITHDFRPHWVVQSQLQAGPQGTFLGCLWKMVITKLCS